jgi:hypothetical protein
VPSYSGRVGCEPLQQRDSLTIGFFRLQELTSRL